MNNFDTYRIPFNVGEKVKLIDPGIIVTVRKIRQVAVGAYGKIKHVTEALVDDGDTANPNLETNGFHIARWVEGHEIEAI